MSRGLSLGWCGRASISRRSRAARLELADKAGALEMGLDLADTIQADNSMEKMLVHQMAAVHNSAMRMTALVNRRMESMANIT